MVITISKIKISNILKNYLLRLKIYCLKKKLCNNKIIINYNFRKVVINFFFLFKINKIVYRDLLKYTTKTFQF